MPGTTTQPDPVAVHLAQVREHAVLYRGWGTFGATGNLSRIKPIADDALRLLGAVEAVKVLHQGRIHEDYPQEQRLCVECGEWSPCPTYQAITTALLGEDASDE